MRELSASVCSLGLCGLLVACGLPKAPDIRKQFATNIEALGAGVVAVYPLREKIQIGQLWIVDGSNGATNAGRQPYAPTSILISDDLVGPMEAARRARLEDELRFTKSGSKIGDLLKDGGSIEFQQTDAEKPLELAGVPSYTLASIDQETLAGSVPTVFTSISAALGFSKSESLKVRPIAVEVAEVPLDRFFFEQKRSCSDATQFLHRDSAGATIEYARRLMLQWWTERQAKSRFRSVAEYHPQLIFVRKVFYLRGLEYVFASDQATSAAVAAALKQNFPEGRTPLTPLSLTPPSVAGETAADVKAAGAQVDALNAKVKALSKSIDEANAKSGGGINISGSAVRATSEGVSLVQVFERPLAFGYEPIALDLPADRGDLDTRIVDGKLDAICPPGTRVRAKQTLTPATTNGAL